MARLLTAFVLCAAIGSMSGCMSDRTRALGWTYAGLEWDGEAEVSIGLKEGMACARSILGVPTRGDASIRAAAADGGITNVTLVERFTKHFVIVGENCTVVRGN